MFTLITFEYENSLPVIRKNQPLPFCHAMSDRGGFYKVQIIDQSNDTILKEVK